MIEHTNFHGIETVRFEAGGYRALLLSGFGANLIELEYLPLGMQLLRTPASREELQATPMCYGIPVLFFPNRIEDGRMRTPHRAYTFPINDEQSHSFIHGFLAQRPWQLVDATQQGEDVSIRVRTRIEPGDWAYACLGHLSEYTLTYTLGAQGLSQRVTVRNLSDIPMPMGLGYHTALRVPFHEQANPADYRLFAGVERQWELTQRVMPTGKLLPLSPSAQRLMGEGFPVHEEVIGDGYLMRDLAMPGGPRRGAVLRDNGSAVELVYEVDDAFTQWIIWNDTAHSGFICPEPQTWITNAPNLDMPEAGFALLEPGAEFSAGCRMSLRAVRD